MDKYLPGDIFLTNSTKIGARIIKFLQIAPTVWQYIWRAVRGSNQKVRYYHAGVFVDNDYIIEQQRVVEIDKKDTILYKPHIIYRQKNLINKQRLKIVEIAKGDLGEGYDILLCVGKLFTWLTGVSLFTRWIQEREKEICVTRVAFWYKKAIGETFGKKTHHQITTNIIDNYCYKNTEEWEIVERKS